MNDITALPPVTPEMLASLKLSASNLAEGEMMSFEPAVFRALVEALEKAQAQSSKWLEAYHKAVSVGARYEERIAELESHTITVKLPPRVDSSNVPFTAHTWNCCLDEVERCLAAAGIQVIEGEGQ